VFSSCGWHICNAKLGFVSGINILRPNWRIGNEVSLTTFLEASNAMPGYASDVLPPVTLSTDVGIADFVVQIEGRKYRQLVEDIQGHLCFPCAGQDALGQWR
jgi:hypothetical protein